MDRRRTVEKLRVLLFFFFHLLIELSNGNKVDTLGYRKQSEQHNFDSILNLLVD